MSGHLDKEKKNAVSTPTKKTHLLLENLDLLFLLPSLLRCHDSYKSQISVTSVSRKVTYKNTGFQLYSYLRDSELFRFIYLRGLAEITMYFF